MCVSGGKKCSFFGKFGVVCFLETTVLRFALLPYYRRHYASPAELPSYLPVSYWKWNKFWTFTECKLVSKIKYYTSLSLNITYLIYYTFLCFRYELTSWNKKNSYSFVVSSLSYDVLVTCFSYQITLPSLLFTEASIASPILIAWLARSFDAIYGHWFLIPTDEASLLYLLYISSGIIRIGKSIRAIWCIVVSLK